MTGYTVHTGSSMKFSEGWDQIFRGAKSKGPAARPESTGSTSNKKAVKKSAAKATKVTAKRAVKKGTAKKSDSKKVKRGK